MHERGVRGCEGFTGHGFSRVCFRTAIICADVAILSPCTYLRRSGPLRIGYSEQKKKKSRCNTKNWFNFFFCALNHA